MGYKTVLLHLNDERRVKSLVEAAAFVAMRHDAHLIGLYVLPPVPTYGATPLGAGMIESGMKAFRAEAARVHAAFEDATRGRSIACEWRLVDPHRHGLAETVIDHGRCADLVILSQRDRSWEYSTLLEEPERISVECGRPVLLIPHAGRFASFGRRVTVAWNGRREAARATFDALPFLKQAESVRIQWIEAKESAADSRRLPAAEIATALARHGVKCEASTAYATDVKVGDIMLSSLVDDGSDMLVMGAYGHSRLREFMFGGTTRHILDHMTVPVLMSH